MLHHALILLLLAGPVQTRQDFVCEPALRTPAGNGGNRNSTVRVLFLGNSHTYVNQLPCLVQRLASSLQPGINLEVVAVARDGATLEQHWADSSTRTLLQDRAWDFVVLQEQGRRPVEHHELTSAAVRRFADAVRRVGARLVLYIPPVALRRSSELPRITAVYQQIAAATQSTIAPVAQAWEDVRRADTTLRLHGADGVHASAMGSYLSACVLLAAITARSPEKVAPLLLRRPYGSAPATVAIPDTIERSRARALQVAAWRAVRESLAILHRNRRSSASLESKRLAGGGQRQRGERCRLARGPARGPSYRVNGPLRP
jgi:hypothetical protein